MHFKKEKCVGGKFRKQKLKGLAAGNALDQKLLMFVVGKTNKPRCLLKHLPCCYRGQNKTTVNKTTCRTPSANPCQLWAH